MSNKKDQVFKQHFNVVGKSLAAEASVAKSFHNRTNKGNIRETFVRELLDRNTSMFCSIGQGEIIHPDMRVEDKRNQIDVIVYNNRYPKLTGSGGVDLFFVETVFSFIEVKSVLTKVGIRKAAQSSKRIKSNCHVQPQRLNPTGEILNPRPYSFLFAYDVKVKSIETVKRWLKEIAAEDDYNIDQLKKTDPHYRPFFRNLFLDGVFVLGKGYVLLDVLPFESVITSIEKVVSNESIWFSSDKDELQTLWIIINTLAEKLMWNDVDLIRYCTEGYITISE